MPNAHDKIIAEQAKTALGPLGFRRKGRSRIWLADHGWWLAVVEFQPSQWSKGCYLNVGAHFLWGKIEHLSFDYGGRVAEYEEFLSEEQFAVVTSRLAKCAWDEAQKLRQSFSSLEAAADILVLHANSINARMIGHPGWSVLNAGIACGLVGRLDDALTFFNQIVTDRNIEGSVLHSASKAMADAAVDLPKFKLAVALLIAANRDRLKLPVNADVLA